MLLMDEAGGVEHEAPDPSSEVREPEEQGLGGQARPGEYGNKPGAGPESADSRRK